jgi:glutathionylspermidine synthase
LVHQKVAQVVNKIQISKLPKGFFKDLAWDYYISDEAANYLSTEMVVISQQEQDGYYEAANKLYDMFVAAGQHVIDKKLWNDLAIPLNLQEIIELSWEDDRLVHLFSRFDFAGGVDGLPIKLIELNAQTPTTLPETAILQWAYLKANNLDEKKQFNFLYEALVDNFELLLTQNEDREPFLLLSTLRDAPEDEHNFDLLAQAAEEAGFEVVFRYVDEVIISETEGIYIQLEEGKEEYRQCPFWLHLVPYEFMSKEEPVMLSMLTSIVKNGSTLILNPPYTMLFQSKGIMKILWDLYPNDPLLLKTTVQPPFVATEPYVKKTMLGREGANVSIVNQFGSVLEENKGDYGDYPSVYQSYATLAQDGELYYYQAGVFFVGEGCALGFRRSKSKIMDNGAQFVGHVVR